MKTISPTNRLFLLTSIFVITALSAIPATAEKKTENACNILTTDTLREVALQNIGDTIPSVTKRRTDAKTDSTTVLLPETTVEADSYMRTAKKSVFIPDKRQKNSAVDAMALLDRMNIPQLIKSPSGGFKASNGGDITYFINGIPAEGEDLSGMNLSDVRKVEYLDFPSESNFLGAHHVINFIVRKYEYGGYTRLAINHSYIDGNELGERLFSKWSQGRMTFDVSLAPWSNHVLHDTYSSEETFRFDSGVVKRKTVPSASGAQYLTLPAKLRAVYAHGSTYISNSVGYSFHRRGDAFSEGKLIYEGESLSGSGYKKLSPSDVSSVNWVGFGSFGLKNGWSLSARGNLFYSHYKYRRSYITYPQGEGDDGKHNFEIRNFINENSIDGTLEMMVNKGISRSQSVNFMLKGSLHDSRMRYLNDDNRLGKFNLAGMFARAGYNLYTGKMNMNVNIGIGHESSRMDGYTVNTLYPFGTLSLSYMINRSNNLDLWMQYSTFSPQISEKNPMLVRRDQIMYTKGNPDLKPFPRYEISINYMLRPTTNFRIFTMFHWNHTFNTAHSVYETMADNSGMLNTYINSGHTDDVSLRVNFALELFKRKLVITTTPEYRIQHNSLKGYPTLHPYEVYSTVTGYIGNFNIRGEFFTGKSRRYTSQAMDVISDRPHSYGLSVGWGNGKLRAEVTLRNIFRKSCDDTKSLIITPRYTYTGIRDFREDRRMVLLNLSYTFSYGKKIDTYDEVDKNLYNSSSGVNL